MTVISVEELPDGRPGQFESVRGRASRKWRVKTDNRYNDTLTIGADSRLPRYLAAHPSNIFLRCKSLRIEPEHGRTIWIAIAEYDNDPLTQDERDRQIEDPTQRPAKFSVIPNRITVAYDKNYNGRAVLNTAGKYFDPPPETTRTLLTLVIKKNVRTFPTWILEYQDSVNDSEISISTGTFGTITIPKRCGKMGPIPIAEPLEENNIQYLPLELQIELARIPDIVAGQVLDNTGTPTSDIGGWDQLLLNQGLQEVVTDSNGDAVSPPRWKNIELDDGPANAPQPLTTIGTALASTDPNSMFWIRAQPDYPRDWSILSPIWS